MTGRPPRLRPGLVAVALPDGLLVHGGAQRQVFRGRAAVGLLPRLLPLLDGTATADDLAEQIGSSPAQLGQALDLLSSRGLIEYGSAEPIPPGVDPAVAAFLARVGGAAGPDATTADAFERLGQTEIVLVAADGLHLAVVSELAAVGLTRVHHVDPDVLGQAAAMELPPADLVIAIQRLTSPGEHPLAGASLGRRSRPRRARWLRVAPTGTGVEIGPLFGCWKCWNRWNGWQQGRILCPVSHDGHGPQPPNLRIESGAVADQWACLVALEAFDIVTGLRQLQAGSSNRYDLRHWSSEATPPAIPPCRHCSPYSDDQLIDRPALKGGEKNGIHDEH
jgi:hypothetical protein